MPKQKRYNQTEFLEELTLLRRRRRIIDDIRRARDEYSVFFNYPDLSGKYPELEFVADAEGNVT